MMKRWIFYKTIDLFLPFATFINRFVDRGYGPNFDAEDESDRELILSILDLDILMSQFILVQVPETQLAHGVTVYGQVLFPTHQ